MEIQEIEVVVEKNGQVQVHVRGVKGEGCLELTKELEAALGGGILSRQMTADASEARTQQVDEHLWQRSG